MDSCGWLYSEMLPARYPSAYLCSSHEGRENSVVFHVGSRPPSHGLRTCASHISARCLIAGICAGSAVIASRNCGWKSGLGIPVAFEIVNKPRSLNAVMGECRIHFHTSSSIQRPASSEQRTNARLSLQPRPAGFASVAIATHDFGARRVAKAELRILDALLGD